MDTKLPFLHWKPASFGDVIVGHLLYSQGHESSDFVIRSHNAFYHLPTEVKSLVEAERPPNKALVIVEFHPEGYHLCVLYPDNYGDAKSSPIV